jgi:hypothetical protein
MYLEVLAIYSVHSTDSCSDPLLRRPMSHARSRA